MLYLVEMDVQVPSHLSAEAFDTLKAQEKELSHSHQRDGKWRHLWRVAGRYANVSIFDVGSHDELHIMLANLPLFPFMKIQVTPLAQHPSALKIEDADTQ
jgi:muconolactone D-isomerase